MAQNSQRAEEHKRNRTLVPVKKAAYDLFQQALLQGRLRSGQVVSQRDLVNLLGLSIGALRELLPRLQSEGLLTVMPQRGIQITVIDLPMIRDAFQMRLAFEREAVITAVSVLSQETIDNQKRQHTDILERLATNPSEELLDEGQDIDTRFHDLLISCTENELLMQAYNVNSIRIRLIKPVRIRLSETNLPAAFGDHLAILDAINARDRAAAAAAVEIHLRNARDRAIAF